MVDGEHRNFKSMPSRLLWITGREVEATCSKCLVLSLYCREELIDADTIVTNTLHSSWCMAMPSIRLRARRVAWVWVLRNWRCDTQDKPRNINFWRSMCTKDFLFFLRCQPRHSKVRVGTRSGGGRRKIGRTATGGSVDEWGKGESRGLWTPPRTGHGHGHIL